MEKVCKFENGMIVKYDKESGLFYSLDNNKWVLNPYVMDMYFDAGYPYEELDEETVKMFEGKVSENPNDTEPKKML